MTNKDAILEVMSHEIGHPAGLDDCSTCTPTDSVMAPGPPLGQYNTVVGRVTSPTDCDKHNLQASDYPPCNPPVNISDCAVWDPNTCTCGQYVAGTGDVGGEGAGGGHATRNFALIIIGTTIPPTMVDKPGN